jgi:hypothetical protein
LEPGGSFSDFNAWSDFVFFRTGPNGNTTVQLVSRGSNINPGNVICSGDDATLSPGTLVIFQDLAGVATFSLADPNDPNVLSYFFTIHSSAEHEEQRPPSVPTPGTLPLLMGALGLVGVGRSRRRN